jgi:hypothetical protein
MFSFIVSPIAAVADEEDAAAIKKLIPAASAMARNDFLRLAKSGTTPRASDIEDKSLTLMLLTLRTTPQDDEERKQQFSFITNGVPKAAELAAEMDRSKRIGNITIPLGPVTMIHANRITDLTASVDADGATGSVSFTVPKLYQGRVDYVARSEDGKWRIEEFRLPAFDIHITLSEDGRWTKK